MMKGIAKISVASLLALGSVLANAKGGGIKPGGLAAAANHSGAFIENKGQWNQQAKFVCHSAGLDLWVTSSGMTMDFKGPLPKAKSDSDPERMQTTPEMTEGQVVKATFVGTRPLAFEGFEPQQAKATYMIGADRSKWARGARAYSEVRSSDRANGISVRYYSEAGTPRYDIVVDPGADISNFGLKFEGANGMRIDENGELAFRTSVGTAQMKGLTAYQESGGVKTEVACRMEIDGSVLRFRPGSYDESKPLIIDPLIFSTLISGTTPIAAGQASGSIFWVKPDGQGNIAVAGFTEDTDFPTTTGAYQTSAQGGNFVAKFSDDGSQLLSSTYFGYGRVNCATMDSEGNFVLGGHVSFGTQPGEITTFPTTVGAYESSPAAQPSGQLVSAAFVVRISGDGTQLVSSTLLYGGPCSTQAGPDGTICFGIAVDSQDNAVMAGVTYDPGFPITPGAYQTTYLGQSFFYQRNCFISKVSPDAKTLVDSTFFGGPTDPTDATGDAATAVTLDSLDNVFITGWGSSTKFPTTPYAYQATNLAANYNLSNAFVASFSSDLSQLRMSTFIGGTTESGGTAIALDSGGHPVIMGWDRGPNPQPPVQPDFPTTVGAVQTPEDIYGVFYSKFSTDGMHLLFSGFFSGSMPGGSLPPDGGTAFLRLDSNDNIYMAARLERPKDLPTYLTTTPGAYMSTPPSGDIYSGGYFIELSSDASTVLYGSYFGDPYTVPYAMDLDVDGNPIIGGFAGVDFPTTSNAYQQTAAPEEAAFLMKLGIPAPLSLASVSTSATQVEGSIAVYPPAGKNGETVLLKSSNPAVAGVSSSVTFSASQSLRNFVVALHPVAQTTAVTITGTGPYSRSTLTLTATPPSYTGFTLSTERASQFASVTGNLTLSKAPVSTASFSVKSSSPSVAVVPSSVPDPNGATTMPFAVLTKGVSLPQNVTITASFGGLSKTQILQVIPAQLSSLTAPDATIQGGQSVSTTINLAGYAGPSGNVVTMKSSSSAATVNASETVPSNTKSITFPVSTTVVTQSTPVTLTATFDGVSKTCSLTLVPPIASFTVSPASVIGGNRSGGILHLSLPAPAGGAVVTITSSSAGAVVQTAVRVAAGETVASFPITTSAVKAKSSATIKVSYGGGSLSQSLAIAP